MTDDPDPRETRLKRLKIRSWRRGTKEMDLLLGPFADGPLRTLEDGDLEAYEAALEEPDQDLYAWCAAGIEAPAPYRAIIGRVRAFHEIT